MNEEKALNWDDEIAKESEFVLLPAGDYEFTVTGFERSRHPGSEKLPACPKAIISCKIDGGEHGSTTITHNLFLHSKCEGMLSSFFTCLGLKKHGEPFRMNWSKVTGATGRCRIGIRDWAAKDGTTKQSNEIKRFLEPESKPASPAPAQGIYTPGKF